MHQPYRRPNQRNQQNPKILQRSTHIISRQFQQKHLSVKIDNINDIIVNNDNKITEYQSTEMMDLKDKLCTAKSKLDDNYDRAKTDQTLAKQLLDFQNIIDVYKPLRFEIEKRFNAQIVTNAWLKYNELYSHHNIIPDKLDRPFKAFFNAELPGAALCAFNHYMETMRSDMDFDWRASSLVEISEQKPAKNKSMLYDTYGLYEHNRDNWLMNVDSAPGTYINNGDVCDINNLVDWESRIGPNSDYEGVDLYSHDAGIDVSSDYNNQELSNAKIHLGCALAGFMTLRLGGTFIAKQYSFFEAISWNLITIYASLFETFHICKPLTSRPYNSEIYLVGKGFRGLDLATRQLLTNKLTNFDTNPILSETILNSNILKELERFSRIVFGQQIEFLKENMDLLTKYRNNLPALRNGLADFKTARITNWLKLYPVSTIDRKYHLNAKTPFG